MDMPTWAAAVGLSAYLLAVGGIAVIAAVHPDGDRRADARAVLDRLLRLGSRRR